MDNRTVAKEPIQPKLMRHFHFWCQHVLPLVYDDSLSYYEVLCKVVDYLNHVIDDLNNATGQYGEINKAIEVLNDEVDVLNQEIQKVKDGEYIDAYIPALAEWIDKNFKELIGDMVKYVFFGLTDDGHFAAYVPDSWGFIRFDTDIEPTSANYGHLLLYY